MPPELHFDLAKIDFSNVVADLDAIRKVNPQRFEMEQLDAIVMVDFAQKLIVGYKDVRFDEFWVRGHMPGYPLMPGVLMCEAAAQLAQRGPIDVEHVVWLRLLCSMPGLGHTLGARAGDVVAELVGEEGRRRLGGMVVTGSREGV